MRIGLQIAAKNVSQKGLFDGERKNFIHHEDWYESVLLNWHTPKKVQCIMLPRARVCVCVCVCVCLCVVRSELQSERYALPACNRLTIRREIALNWLERRVKQSERKLAKWYLSCQSLHFIHSLSIHERIEGKDGYISNWAKLLEYHLVKKRRARKRV